MVSKAREDLPEPLRPVMTVRVLRGISTEMFLRLCCRAPRTEILVIATIIPGFRGKPLHPRAVPALDGAGVALTRWASGTEEFRSGIAQLYSVS